MYANMATTINGILTDYRFNQHMLDTTGSYEYLGTMTVLADLYFRFTGLDIADVAGN